MSIQVKSGTVMIALAGVGAGVAAISIPAGLLEMAITSSGISEIIPAAAPPLGATARALIAGGASLAAMALAAVTLPATLTSKTKGQKMGFALKKLTSFGRRKSASAHEDAGVVVPTLRRADAHPDAPARSPIIASRDLGKDTNLIAQAVSEIEDPNFADEIVDGALLDMPRSPEPMPWETIKQEMARIHKPISQDNGPIAHIVPSPERMSANALRLPTEGMSIADLTARLEAGLKLRPAPLNAIRTASPVVSDAEAPASAQVTAAPERPREMDEALQAALATLRGITAKAG